MATRAAKPSSSSSQSKYFSKEEGTRRSPRKSKVQGATRKREGDEDSKGELDSDNLDEDFEPGAEKRKRKPSKKPFTKRRKQDSDGEGSDFDGVSEGEDEELDSDNLDEDPESNESRKRKRVSPKKSPAKKSPAKRRKAKQTAGEESDLDLAEGQEVVGVVVQAPKTGRVPPGQISKNTLNFLSELKKPECNDRQWFKLHEPVYRLAEKEFKDFIEAFTDVLVEVDPQIPVLPPKDVTHRIYRDIRFSNDKTPYKAGFSVSFSRSGRKGIFAHYHVLVKPGGESLFAAGLWRPGRNELQTIRNNIQRNPSRLRRILSAPDFVKYFGEPNPNSKSERRSVFGQEDELKTAPKGVDPKHKDIDLLKLRTFAVVYTFKDEEVLSPDWKDELGKIVRIARPFVHCLNDMMTISGGDNDDDDDDDDDEDDGEDDDGAEGEGSEEE